MKGLLASTRSLDGMAPRRCGGADGAHPSFCQWLGITLGVCLVAVSGCAHYPVNQPLGAGDAPGYRFRTASSPTNSDELLLLVAFSGGGMRSSAVSYGVLEELARTEVGLPGQRHPLLAEIDAISCVSGGTFTAAYYALWGDRIFEDFEKRLLKRQIEDELLLRALTPRSRIRLASPRFNLSDLAEEYYDRLLFKGATYHDLAAIPGRPFLLVNAIDHSLGERFDFTQDQFDLIGSDLSPLPLSRAVAAALAFPVLMSPIVVKNYSATCPHPEPEWIGSVLADPSASTEQQCHALAARSYCRDGERRRFIHLVDGGTADNQGLRSLAEVVFERAGAGEGSARPALRKARRIAVISVDADTGAESDPDARERPPPAVDQFSRVMLTMLRRYSSQTTDGFRESARRVARENEAARKAAGLDQETSPAQGAPASLYMIELHFGRLPNEADRRFFNSVPTRLQLPPKSVDRLIPLARSELSRNEEFRRLVRDLAAPPQIKADKP
jgi:NTE family protein